MGIYKRGGVFYSDVYLGGKRVRKPLDTNKSYALIKEAELEKAKLAGRFGNEVKTVTWETFKQEYFTWAATPKSAGTIKWERLAIKRLEELQPINYPAGVTLNLLEKYQAFLEKRGMKVSGNNRLVRAIKVILRRSEKWKYSPPLDWRSVPLLKEPIGKVYYWTKSELKRLLGAASGPNFIILSVCGSFGLRAAEIEHLECSDIDFENGLLYVRHKANWNPKTMRARSIPIPAHQVKVLKKFCKESRDGYVLTGGGAKGRCTLAVYQTLFYRFTKAQGLPGDIRKLRHTYASHCREAGVPLDVLQQWLGHARLQTTMIYAHIGQHHLHSHMATYDAYMAKKA